MDQLDRILGSQPERNRPCAMPWYGKILATGALATAIGAYAEEPVTPATTPSCVVITNDEEAYLSKFDEKVKAVKVENAAAGQPLTVNICDKAGRDALRVRSYVAAAAYYKKCTELKPESAINYERLATVFACLAADERDPKAKAAYFKQSVKHGEYSLAILDKKAEGSNGQPNLSSRGQLHVDLGKTLYQLNQKRDALMHLEDGKRLCPERLDKVAGQYLTELQKNPPK